MKKTPKTPFSTPLSGSAKETEMRFRNILKWKKSRPPMILLVLLLCAALLCCSMVACQEAPSASQEFLKLEAGAAVPKDSTYVTAAGETLNPGQPMPSEVQEGDQFITPQFVYQSTVVHVTVAGTKTEPGWLAALNDANGSRAEITEITESMYEVIDGLPLLSMTGTYQGCAKLTQVPPIPDTVLDMTGTFVQCTSLCQVPDLPQNLDNMSAAFAECTALKEVPAIPVGVVSMEKAFLHCTSLEKTPDFSHCTEFQQFSHVFEGCTALKEVCEIPECITVMDSTFKGCSSLRGTVRIHANIHDNYTCADVFAGCSGLTLTGSCPVEGLEAMADTWTDIHVG